jgi:hypothetical protein
VRPLKNIWTVFISALAIWTTCYQMLTQANVFTGTNYNTVKGEALGCDASLFWYIDCLPISAASGLNHQPFHMQPKWVPTPPRLATWAVIDSCIADLLNAQSLLSGDMTTSRLPFGRQKGLLARPICIRRFSVHRNMRLKLSQQKFSLATVNTDLMFTKSIFLIFSSITFAISYNSSVLNTLFSFL